MLVKHYPPRWKLHKIENGSWRSFQLLDNVSLLRRMKITYDIFPASAVVNLSTPLCCFALHKFNFQSYKKSRIKFSFVAQKYFYHFLIFLGESDYFRQSVMKSTKNWQKIFGTVSILFFTICLVFVAKKFASTSLRKDLENPYLAFGNSFTESCLISTPLVGTKLLKITREASFCRILNRDITA